MAEHPNADLYRRYLDGLMAGDVETVSAMIGDDVVWNEVGGSMRLEGKDALLAQMRAVTGGMEVGFDLHDVVASDDHTVALYTMTAKAGERELSVRIVEIWHVVGGKVTERWTYTDDPEGFISFFTSGV